MLSSVSGPPTPHSALTAAVAASVAAAVAAVADGGAAAAAVADAAVAGAAAAGAVCSLPVGLWEPLDEVRCDDSLLKSLRSESALSDLERVFVSLPVGPFDLASTSTLWPFGQVQSDVMRRTK